MQYPAPTLSEHHGIPVLSNDLPVQFTGSLVFGVGIRDESPRYGGVAHLAEHVVMSRIGRVPIEIDATTADDSVSFSARGSAPQVAGFLNKLSTVVRDIAKITESEVDAQRRIIAAELGEAGEETGDGPLLVRFGAHDLGMLDLGAPANRSLTRQSVIDFVKAWFHAGNAMITLTGPVPESLDVTLPTGGTGARQATASVDGLAAVTGWTQTPVAPVGVSLVLRAHDAGTRVLTQFLIIESLHHTLRTEKKLIYSATPYVGAVDADTRVLSVILDPISRDVLDAAEAALNVIRDLASHGPSAELLEYARADRDNALSDPQFHADGLIEVASRILRHDMPTDELGPAGTNRVTAEQVRDAVAAALPSIVLLITDRARVDAPDELTTRLGLAEHHRPAASPNSRFSEILAEARKRPGTQIFVPKPFRGMRGDRLVIDAERVVLLDKSDESYEVRFDDIVMAGVSAVRPEWDLTTSTGMGIVVDADEWLGGSKIHALFDRRVPTDLRYPIHARYAESTEADASVAIDANGADA